MHGFLGDGPQKRDKNYCSNNASSLVKPRRKYPIIAERYVALGKPFGLNFPSDISCWAP